MIVGLSTLVMVGKLYSPRLFLLHLRQMEGRGINLSVVRYQLVEGFEYAWTQGAWWSVLIGGGTASGLSYLTARWIVRPLLQMERVTREFSTGNLQARLPESEIPELARLANSFNHMAVNLEGVEQRRRELIGDLTHELRTPLTVLQGYLEGLADGTIDPSSDIYQRLARETTRLKRLVDDMQELSKAEAGYLPINLQPIDLPPLLASMIAKFSDQILDNGPELRLDCPSDLPQALADPERVEQILVNLIGNGLRYTAEGSVTVSAWSEPSWIWIAIADTGLGISPEELPHIFERFWRSDRSRSRDSGGTGIGLAITSRLVELQGGEIQVESKLNQGSTFRFSLPLA
ncbi:two-component sensor histidine kinase [Leptolyngbya sp. 'hensonii']|nr:two-component sensor histidine kinase [Leptolyngbya sp. 'hensonii']